MSSSCEAVGISYKRKLLKMDILFASSGEKKSPVLFFLWISYILVTAFLVFHHAFWRDEANIWLIAREVDWFAIYGEAGVNNSPSLWYYILAIPAKLGLPCWTMQWLHWLVACLASWIFIFRSPFSLLFKTSFVLSFYIAYEHAAVSRVYMPTILLMWSACWCYAQRYQRSILYSFILVLLAHTSSFGLFVSFFLGLEFLVEGKSWTPKQRLAAGIIFLAIFLSVLGLLLQKGRLAHFANFAHFVRLGNVRDVLSFSYLPPNSVYYFPDSIKSILGFIAPWLGALYWILTLTLLKQWKRYGLILFLFLTWGLIVYFSVFKYPWPGPRHYSFCLIFTVFVLWLGKFRGLTGRTALESLVGTLLLGAFVFGVFGTVVQSSRDLKLPFSGSRSMADYLIENKLDDKILVAQDPRRAIAILPYLSEASLWDPKWLETVSYYHFGHRTRFAEKNLKVGRILRRVKRRFISPGPAYLILQERVSGQEEKRLKLLYFADGQLEKFWLYSMAR